MSTPHWGEIPEPQLSDLFVPDVSTEIEKSMDECCLDEYQDDEDNLHVGEIRLPPMDPLMMYAISLHKYVNNMTEMIRVAELAMEMNVIAPEDAKPPIPEIPDIKIKHKPNSLNFIFKDFTNLSEVQIPELSEAVVKKIITKCVPTMFAHIGFETTHQSVLDIMIDVFETFLKTFCTRLVDATEEEEKTGTGGFPHVIERVLTETGLGGVKGLQDYYNCRVIKYINVLQKRCRELDSHYAALLIPKSESPVGEVGKLFKVQVKVEEEEVVNDTENPELHFTTLDGEVCSTLEPGYQLLNSLEAEANLQSLTENEEEASSASPSVVSIPPDAEICNLSPFTKKKRFK